MSEAAQNDKTDEIKLCLESIPGAIMECGPWDRDGIRYIARSIEIETISIMDLGGMMDLIPEQVKISAFVSEYDRAMISIEWSETIGPA